MQPLRCGLELRARLRIVAEREGELGLHEAPQAAERGVVGAVVQLGFAREKRVGEPGRAVEAGIDRFPRVDVRHAPHVVRQPVRAARPGQGLLAPQRIAFVVGEPRAQQVRVACAASVCRRREERFGVVEPARRFVRAAVQPGELGAHERGAAAQAVASRTGHRGEQGLRALQGTQRLLRFALPQGPGERDAGGERPPCEGTVRQGNDAVGLGLVAVELHDPCMLWVTGNARL